MQTYVIGYMHGMRKEAAIYQYIHTYIHTNTYKLKKIHTYIHTHTYIHIHT